MPVQWGALLNCRVVILLSPCCCAQPAKALTDGDSSEGIRKSHCELFMRKLCWMHRWFCISWPQFFSVIQDSSIAFLQKCQGGGLGEGCLQVPCKWFCKQLSFTKWMVYSRENTILTFFKLHTPSLGISPSASGWVSTVPPCVPLLSVLTHPGRTQLSWASVLPGA